MRLGILKRNNKVLAGIVTSLMLSVTSPNCAQSVSPNESVEKRIYEVLIDDHPAGNYVLKIATHGNEIDLSSDCEISHKVLIIHYHYKYHGHEHWSGNRITAFESESDDNGKHCTIAAHATPDGIEAKVNNKVHTIDKDVLPSSYWHLPGAPFDRMLAKYLEVDSGRVFNAEICRLGDETIKIGDRSELCHHYSLKGGDSCDLWYDSAYRMVRQNSGELGHKSSVQLRSIQH